VHQWATKPLDFDPGTQYQYSNTNFVLLGLIVQKVSGEPFWTFLKSRVIDPVGLTHTIDLDTQRDQLEPIGYFRNALGPLRPAIPEAPGWYFADGELAMPVGDLLRWDISMMNESLLSHASYAAMESPTRLRNGLYSNYGLGVSAGAWNGHRMVSHNGEVGGFVAWNAIFPDDHVAIAVFTNQEASPAAGAIGRALSALMIPATGAAATADVTARAEQLARTTLAGLQHGAIDPTRFTDNAKFYFDRTALGDYASSLGKLGTIRSIHQTASFDRGGMTYRGFAVEFANGTSVNLSTFTVPDGRYEQFLVEPGG
jgi:CubicO group peptidase (beta-lactamase class C family)